MNVFFLNVEITISFLSFFLTQLFIKTINEICHFCYLFYIDFSLNTKTKPIFEISVNLDPAPMLLSVKYFHLNICACSHARVYVWMSLPCVLFLLLFVRVQMTMMSEKTCFLFRPIILNLPSSFQMELENILHFFFKGVKILCILMDI